MGVRSGTQNVVGAVGFAAALSDTIASKNLDHVLNIRNHIEQKIKEICAEVIIISDDSKRLVNTVMIAMPNVSSEVQIMSFDMAGIAVSAGSACSSGKTEVSYVLLAMGVAEELAGCAIRISLAKSVTIEQADKFLQVWQEIYNKNKYKKAC
jgi:cysteine desulfurase